MPDGWEKLQAARAQTEAERRQQEERERDKAMAEQRTKEAQQQAARAADALATRVFERFKVIHEEIRSKDPSIRTARQSAVHAYPLEISFLEGNVQAGGIVELRWGDRHPPYSSKLGDTETSIRKLNPYSAVKPIPTPAAYHFIHLNA